MIIAVDTGGTKTLVASFSRAGEKIDCIRFPTPPESKQYIDNLVKAINELSPEPPTVISIALPDITKGKAFSYQVEKFSHIPWKNFNVIDELASHYPNTKLLTANDANLGALGETRSLRNPPHTVLYVTISTGIGTGVIVNGELDNAFTRSEGGHLMLEYDGVLRDWDDFGSGKAVYETYGKYASEITSERAWHQITNRISRGFFALIPIVRPDLIIIGGSMGVHFDKFGNELMAILAEKLPDTLGDVPKFVQAQHPEEAVIYGCYYYALSQSA